MNYKFIYRQITSSLKQTYVFIACVALSLVTLVSLGGFGESVNNALLRDARKLLAGDIVIDSQFPYEQPLVDELDLLRDTDGVEVAYFYEFITIVQAKGEDNNLLAELKVVEPGYPFYGEVVLSSGDPFAKVLQAGQAVVDINLLDRMGLEIGDPLEVGETTVTIVDIVESEPDQPVDFFTLGPRVFLAAADLESTGLIKLGSRVNYGTLLKVDDENQVDPIAAQLTAAANLVNVEIDTYRTNQSAVQVFFDNFLTFLALIGLFTLLLAGLGTQSSLGSFIREKEETIAVLRTIGATGNFIMRQYFGVAAILGGIGTLIGLALGLVLQWIFPVIFGPFLPPQVEFVLSGQSIVEGLILGFFVVGIFTFLPIYQLQGMKPRFIFRKESGMGVRSRVFIFAQALILVFLTAMTFRYLRDPQRTAYFAIGLVVLVLIVAGLAKLLLFFLQRQKIARLDLRQAVRGLFRPRNATLGIIVTLGASLAVLFTIFLIERNLDASFVAAYPEDAPNVFLLDIQPDQREGIRAILGEDTDFIALITARISKINGEAVPEPESQPNQGPGPGGPRQLGGSLPVTYRETLNPNEFLLKGDTLYMDDSLGLAQVSVTESFLEVYPFEIGDQVEFEIQGVGLTATVTSIRGVTEFDQQFGPPFSFIFREQDLINAPQTIVTATNIPDDDIPRVQGQLVEDFPNITLINISAAIDVFSAIVRDITTIIRFFTVFSIVAGILIIISSVLATRFARIQESVYFKVLGAKRVFVLRVFALENVFIGLVSAFLALFLSQAASWLLVTQVFELGYEAYWGSSTLLMLFTVALVTTVGLLASVSILRQKPISFLRENTVE